MIKSYESLSDEQLQRVHCLRLSAGYTYRKRRWSLDKTFYYNRIVPNGLLIN